MPKTPEPISKAEMEVHLERLMEHRSKDRYTIADMAFLTGWSQNWLRILRREGKIPEPMHHNDPQNTCYWDEYGARIIMGLRRDLDKKRGEREARAEAKKREDREAREARRARAEAKKKSLTSKRG